MARSKRKDAQRRSGPQVDPSLRDLADLVCEEEWVAGSVHAPDIFNLEDTGLRCECWSGASCVVSSTFGSGSTAWRRATQRLRHPPRRQPPLHRPRPSQKAQARFTQEDCEILL